MRHDHFGPQGSAARPAFGFADWFVVGVTVLLGACSTSVAGSQKSDAADAAHADILAIDGASPDAGNADAWAIDLGGTTPDGASPDDARVADAGQTPIAVVNLAPNEELGYRLALIVGTVAVDATEVMASANNETRAWPAVAGRFKAIVPLHVGDNAITLSGSGSEHTLHLTYEPQGNPRFVRLVFAIASDGDGSFDAPPNAPHDQASAEARLRVAAQLMQTFTAEALAREGLGRKTFRLEHDAQGDPIIRIFRSNLSNAEARAMDGGALWSHFYGELESLPSREESIDVVMMGMTHYDPASRVALAHTALGGGRLALFGSGTLHTFPESLDDLVARFSDPTIIDPSMLFDDSGERGTYWAGFSTGVGAMLHELGHCLSLPHPASRLGIMSRGFDQFNRMFMLVEPPSLTSAGLNPIPMSREVGWDRSAAVRLRFHRWLALSDIAYVHDLPPTIFRGSADLIVESAAGIRHIAYHVNGDVATHDEFLVAPVPSFTVPISNLRAEFPGINQIRVTAIDDEGNIAESDVSLQ